MTVLTTQTDTINFPFTNIELTNAINVLPAISSRLAQAGMFPVEGLASPIVEIDIENGVITALPVTQDGKPSTVAKRDTQNARIFKIPNISHEDNMMAAEIRSMLAIFQRTKKPATMANIMNKRLARLRLKHDLTLELMRMSALKGRIVDGGGNLIYDLFIAFGLNQTVVNFQFSNNALDVLSLCSQIIGQYEDSLSDETMTGVKVYVDTLFFNALIDHPNVVKFWLNWDAADKIANPNRGESGQYRPRTFVYGDVVFEEYRWLVPMWGGGSQRIIEQQTGYAFPLGTVDSHVTYSAPPLDIRVLDGEPASEDDLIHVTTEFMKHGAGVEFKGQQNSLPLWRRPNLLTKLTMS